MRSLDPAAAKPRRLIVQKLNESLRTPMVDASTRPWSGAVLAGWDRSTTWFELRPLLRTFIDQE